MRGLPRTRGQRSTHAHARARAAQTQPTTASPDACIAHPGDSDPYTNASRADAGASAKRKVPPLLPPPALPSHPAGRPAGRPRCCRALSHSPRLRRRTAAQRGRKNERQAPQPGAARRSARYSRHQPATGTRARRQGPRGASAGAASRCCARLRNSVRLWGLAHPRTSSKSHRAHRFRLLWENKEKNLFHS